MIHQLKLQALAASSRTKEAIDSLCMDENDINEEIETRKGALGWLSGKYMRNQFCRWCGNHHWLREFWR